MKFCKVSLTRMGHKKKHCRVDIVPFPGGSQGWGGVRSGVMQGMLCAELRGRSGNGFARKTSTGGQKAVALSGLLSKAKLVQAEVDTTMKPRTHSMFPILTQHTAFHPHPFGSSEWCHG